MRRPNHSRSSNEQQQLMESPPLGEEIGGNDTSPGFAAVAHELAAADDDRTGVQINGKRKRAAGATDSNGDQQVSGGDSQEPVEPTDGTIAPSLCPSPHTTHDPTLILSWRAALDFMRQVLLRLLAWPRRS